MHCQTFKTFNQIFLSQKTKQIAFSWMENASCVQPHVHKIPCKLDVWEKENVVYKTCNNSKENLKLRNKVHGAK
jgi:hypothetical protein